MGIAAMRNRTATMSNPLIRPTSESQYHCIGKVTKEVPSTKERPYGHS